MLDEKFDNITADIGQELKDTARRIYKRALVVLIVFFVIELIAAIAISADSGEQLPAVVLTLFAIVIEYLAARGIIHLITINLYAKGEMVHLLQKANLSKQNTEAVQEQPTEHKISQTAKFEDKTSPIAKFVSGNEDCGVQSKNTIDDDADKIKCPKCGYKQPSDRFVCWKCGAIIKKPLPEMLKHALNCQTDDGMILYLKTIEDTSLAPILQLPKNCVRAAVVNLLERLERL